MSHNRKGFKMKKLKFLLATLVFLLIVLVCSQVNAAAPTTITDELDLAKWMNEFGGKVKVDGTTVTLQNNVKSTEDLYIYDSGKRPLTIDLNGYALEFEFASKPGVAAIWANNLGDLKIFDSTKSGKSYIKTNIDSVFAISSSTLTVENVNIIGAPGEDSIFANSGTNTTILKNLTITSNSNVIGTQQHTNYNFENVTFNIGNVAFDHVIQVGGYSEVALKNCNYNSSTDAGYFLVVKSDSAKATIDGGTYTYGGPATTKIGESETRYNYLIKTEDGILEINDGTFKATNTLAVRNEGGSVTINSGTFEGKDNAITAIKASTLSIKGGYFKCNPTDSTDTRGAIAFSSSKALSDIIPGGYYITDSSVVKNSMNQYNETVKEVYVYGNPTAITLEKNAFTYNGKVQKPKIVVKDSQAKVIEAFAYDIKYSSESKDAGEYKVTVKFKGNYTGAEKELTYKINKANYDMSKVKFENMTVAYDGKAHGIEATGLPTGVKATYENNGKVDLGKYEITANFIGDSTNYNAIPSKKATLTISQKNVADLEVSGIKDKTYTGKKLTQALTIKNGDIVLTDGVDYSVEYKSNKKIGIATISITGKGNYTGTVSKTFKIKPKGTSIKKLTANKKGFKATWKAQKTQTTGYEVQYSTNSKFKSGNKKVKIKKNKTISTTVKKLKGKKKYYVRIRTYKSVNGKKIYSDWSKSKKVTTKK